MEYTDADMFKQPLSAPPRNTPISQKQKGSNKMTYYKVGTHINLKKHNYNKWFAVTLIIASVGYNVLLAIRDSQ
jgi:hypothetical protein